MATIFGKKLNFTHDNLESADQRLFHRHIHNYYEILYFKKGDADYIIGSTRYHLTKNDLLIIKPLIYHYIKLNSSAAYERFVVHFSGDAIPDGINEFLVSSANVYKIQADDFVDRSFFELSEIAERFSEDDAQLALRQKLYTVLLHLKYSSCHKTEQPQVIDEILNKVLKYIDDNLTEPLSVDVLTKHFYISPSLLFQKFKKYLNISIMQYINRKKIIYAQSLIHSGIKPTKVAKICAFNNYSTFYRSYRQYLNTIPEQDKT